MRLLLLVIIFLPLLLIADGETIISENDKKRLNDLISSLTKKPGTPFSKHLKDIKIWDSSDSIRVVLYPDKKVKFKYNLLPGDDLDRIYIDLIDVSSPDFELPQPDPKSFLKKIRLGKRKTGLRVVLDTGRVETYNVLVMDSPWRIVVDFYNRADKHKKLQRIASVSEKKAIKQGEKKKKSVIKPVNEDVFTVVIDPGHGGKDPGAVAGSIYEKDIVFKLAKIMQQRAAEKHKNIRVVLTRNNDTFLPLEERAIIANRLNGDLFISLHVNAFMNNGTTGIEVYHLDNRRSEYTDKLAMVENKLTNKSSLLNTILVDMTMSMYIKDSLKFAEGVGKSLENGVKPFNIPLRDYRKGALFYVLVGARMPSLLLEVGFLTNERERRLLTSNTYLETIADNILSGVHIVTKTNTLTAVK